MTPVRFWRLAIVAIVAATLAGVEQSVHSQQKTPTITVGRNVHVSRSTAELAMGEVLVAADPFDANALLACAMAYVSDSNARVIYTYRSADRGETWERTLDSRAFTDAADPACAFGRDGLAYTGFLASNERGGGFVLFRSSDRGTTWTEAARMIRRSVGFDRESIVVDTTGGRFEGTVYVSGSTGDRMLTPPPSMVSAIGVWSSRDRGATFDLRAQRLSPPTSFIAGQGNSVVLSDGTIVCIAGELIRYRGAGGERDMHLENSPDHPSAILKAVWSSDGGETLEPAVTLADWYMPSLYQGASPVSLAVDASATFKDRLFAVWPDERSGRVEIYLSWSADRGKTWSAPRVVSDDRSPANHGMPSVAVNRDGVVGVMWYDRRAVPDGLGWDVRFAASLDGGLTFLPSHRVSETPIRFPPDLKIATIGRAATRTAPAGADGGGVELGVDVWDRQFVGGDYAGLAADAGGTFHPVWLDHRTGIPQVWSASVVVGGRALKYGSADLEDWRDISQTVSIKPTASRYDARTGEATLTIAVENHGREPIDYPIKLQVLGLTSDVAEAIEVLDAENGRRGIGAVLRIDGASPHDRLLPGASIKPPPLRFRLINVGAFRRDQKFHSGLAKLQGRLLARPQASSDDRR